MNTQLLEKKILIIFSLSVEWTQKILPYRLHVFLIFYNPHLFSYYFVLCSIHLFASRCSKRQESLWTIAREQYKTTTANKLLLAGAVIDYISRKIPILVNGRFYK